MKTKGGTSGHQLALADFESYSYETLLASSTGKRLVALAYPTEGRFAYRVLIWGEAVLETPFIREAIERYNRGDADTHEGE